MRHSRGTVVLVVSAGLPRVGRPSGMNAVCHIASIIYWPPSYAAQELAARFLEDLVSKARHFRSAEARVSSDWVRNRAFTRE